MFFFNDTATTEIYTYCHTLSLHDALPIFQDLARRLDVSEETIRRNVKKLAGRGLVRKVHGGVYLPDAVQEAPFAQRMDENPDAKRLIASQVARMIKNGDSLILDIG